MKVDMKRRDFLRLSGSFVLAASLPFKSGCGDGGSDSGVYTFPQGLASGDPRETSVVLWTRVQLAMGTTSEAIAVTVQVATDAEFANVVAEQMVTATAAADHTLRVLVTGLTAATHYHYRFTAGGDSLVGRTRTAAAANADVPVHLAWVSCQDYAAGRYDAYRELLAEDDARAEADKIQFVVHMGDYIYESRGSMFQVPLGPDFLPTTISGGREIPPFPDSTSGVAETLADYRHLYKSYLADPQFQAARARWPFIHTWDDHEFSNDCWQSQANYDDPEGLEEPSATRKVAANQAWFEYVPCQLTGAPGVAGVTQRAKDFTAATVTNSAFGDAVDEDGFYTNADNVAAVGSMTIYRSFRFGQHIELVMTDQRSYRSDHALPEDEDAYGILLFDPRNALPKQMVDVFDAGNTANGGAPPASVLGVANPRTNSPPGTMLGADQKAWFKATMTGSNATWKLWGNEVPMMRMRIKPDGVPLLQVERVLNGDAWDGYPGERRELLSFLRSEGVSNVVVITGDIHAHFAGVLMDDYDSGTPNPVAVELVAAGISSNSLMSFFEFATRSDTLVDTDLRKVITFDGGATNGAFVENMNVLVLHGTQAALTFAQTNDLGMGLAQADATLNPHLKYADTNAQGYGTLSANGTEIRARLVTVERPVSGTGGVKRVASFTVPKDNPAGLTGPTFTGTPPIPFGS
jgi:alkaline phosphatase D